MWLKRVGSAAHLVPNSNGLVLVHGGEIQAPFNLSMSQQICDGSTVVKRCVYMVQSGSEERRITSLVSRHLFGDLLLFDIVTGRWYPCPYPHTSPDEDEESLCRSWHAMVEWNGEIFMFGGQLIDGRSSHLYRLCGHCNISLCKPGLYWTPMKQHADSFHIPGLNSYSMVVSKHDNCLYIVGGGYQSDNGLRLSSDIYRGRITGTDEIHWTRLSSCGLPDIWGHTCLDFSQSSHNTTILILYGGMIQDEIWNNDLYLGVTSASDDSILWSVIPFSTNPLNTPSPAGRHGHSATKISDTEFIVYGGWGPGGDSFGDTWKCTIDLAPDVSAKWTRLKLPHEHTDIKRDGHASIYFDGCVYVIGGKNNKTKEHFGGVERIQRVQPATLYNTCIESILQHKLEFENTSIPLFLQSRTTISHAK